MRAAILDYGAGNLHSLAKALLASGAEVRITRDVAIATNSDALILPGVGAFGSAAQLIAPHADRITAALSDGLPCLGICLGMQLLFETSEEGGGRGLGILKGNVRRLRAKRVPQIGWNAIERATEHLVSESGLETAYFANSYVCEPADPSSISSWATHETDTFVASVRSGRTIGVQFHPEKSSRPGLRLIRAFIEEAGA